MNGSVKKDRKFSKRAKIIITTSAVVIALIIAGSIISYSKLKVVNPFSSAVGLFRINYTDTEYLQIQKHPKRVIIAKDLKMLNKALTDKGYDFIEEEQLGSKHTIEKYGAREQVFISYSENITRCVWDE